MPEITIPQVIQLIGVLVSFLVVANQILSLVANQILSLIIYGRGGSPEIRTMRDQIKTSNELLKESNDRVSSDSDRMYRLFERVIERLDERG